MLENLKKYRIILASKSPRRRTLLQQVRIPFTVVTLGNIKEEYPDTLKPEEIAPYLSRLKAQAYRKIVDDNELVITADTVVICDDKVMGKPHNLEEARSMLHTLADKTHMVMSGVTVLTHDRCETISVGTKVTFSPLTDEEINFYVDGFTPLDKAGAYGIQEWIGSVAVECIEGSFYNVMGLPLHQLYKLLRTF